MGCDDQTYSLDALLLLFFGCRGNYGRCGLRNLGSHERQAPALTWKWEIWLPKQTGSIFYTWATQARRTKESNQGLQVACTRGIAATQTGADFSEVNSELWQPIRAWHAADKLEGGPGGRHGSEEGKGCRTLIERGAWYLVHGVMSMVLLNWVLAGHAEVFIGLARIKHH